MRRGVGIPRPARLEFYDAELRVYRPRLKILREGEFSLLYRVSYSEVQLREHSSPRVESSKLTLGGFAWAGMPAEIELSIPGPGALPARPERDSSWNRVLIRFSGEGMSGVEFQGVYSWLRTKLGLPPTAV
jgi:hypothetical protein